MGEVDLHFKPTVPVFDANVALGRRHDRPVAVDTLEGTLEAMDRAGVERALVYSPHAAAFDALEGNDLLWETVRETDRLVPQHVANPAYDDLESFASDVGERGVRSVRLFPDLHRYPFRGWVVDPWLEWLSSEGIPLWVSAPEVGPAELHDTIASHPRVTVVLCDVHYRDLPWAMPLLRSLPNVHVDISRAAVGDGIPRLLRAVGHERVVFGSMFPDLPMAPQLYALHRCGLSDPVLAAVCSENLQTLLGKG